MQTKNEKLFKYVKLRITESSAAFKRALDKDVFLNLL